MSRQRKDDVDAVTTRLGDGTIAQVVASDVTTGYELIVDGTPQSHVDLDDPTHLHFEYIARMGAVIDQLRMPGQPITAVHLGAGAMTLPRYIEATRPGSRQQVIELESALVDLVRGALPLPKGAAIRVRHGDAREVLGRLPAALHGAADLVVADVFSGAQAPAHVTSLEFYREVSTFLAPDGALLVNVADGPGLAYARRQIATLQAVLPNVAVLAEVQVLKGRRFGNLVLAASQRPLPMEWLPRLMAAGPHPAKIATGREVDELARGAAVVMDAAAVASPKPDTRLFER